MTKDISMFISDFLSLLISCFRTVFNTLDSITFFGFSLLTYLISLLVLSVAVPILISILNTRSTKLSVKKRSGKVKSESDEE